VTTSFDSLGRRTAVNRPGSAADSAYTYETDNDLASLSHAFVPGTGPGTTTFSYGHDASAKITSVAIDQPVFEWMPTLAYDRTYGAANALNQVTSEDSVAVSYNTDGNMTSDGINSYTWTFGNRMIGAARSGMTASYAYDGDDRRTKKTVNGVVTRTLWSGADELAQMDNAGTTLRRFVPDGSGAMDARLATVEADGTVYWHHTDHQGSVIATSTADGQVFATAAYSPYGEFAGSVTAPPTHSPFGYTGRQYDDETGLYQYRARYYSPRLGVFLSNDPIGTKDDPNLYMYVGLDPVNRIDPTGARACPPTCPLTQIFVGGGADACCTGITRDYAEQWQRQYPDRQIIYRSQTDGEIISGDIEAAQDAGFAVDVIGHSYGATTAARAITESYGEVRNFITIDPVGRLDGMGGERPDNIENWLNVVAEPSAANRTFDDTIAWLGGHPSALPVDEADTNVTLDATHGNFAGMMRASGAESLLRQEPTSVPCAKFTISC
jgi:RHS repeat-associated protein